MPLGQYVSELCTIGNTSLVISNIRVYRLHKVTQSVSLNMDLCELETNEGVYTMFLNK